MILQMIVPVDAAKSPAPTAADAVADAVNEALVLHAPPSPPTVQAVVSLPELLPTPSVRRVSETSVKTRSPLLNRLPSASIAPAHADAALLDLAVPLPVDTEVISGMVTILKSLLATYESDAYVGRPLSRPAGLEDDIVAFTSVASTSSPPRVDSGECALAYHSFSLICVHS